MTTTTGAVSIDLEGFDVDAFIAGSVVVSCGNLYCGTSGDAPADPNHPYSTALTPAASVDVDVRGGAGPR